MTDTRETIRSLLKEAVDDPVGQAMGVESHEMPLEMGGGITLERWKQGKRAIIVRGEDDRSAGVLLSEREVQELIDFLGSE